jgi:hypothetical protein
MKSSYTDTGCWGLPIDAGQAIGRVGSGKIRVAVRQMICTAAPKELDGIENWAAGYEVPLFKCWI